MRILFDIVHPAHVHFFKHMIRELRERGHAIAIVARRKDVTSALLEQLGLEHELLGESKRKGRVGQLRELLERDIALARFARRFGADLIATRNPAGVQAARLSGAVGVFDTDDGSAAGIHFQAARPFAHYLTSPDCLLEDWGRRHVPYRGYKQLAYLHPDHFSPDPSVLEELEISPGERFFVVRFVAMEASHDSGESGMTEASKSALIERLRERGRVLLTCETGVPERWRHVAYTLAPHRLHDLLAFATLAVGDSQTMAAEAAVLGTPSLRASTFAGRISYLEELEHRYGLTWGFHPSRTKEFFEKLDELLAHPDLRRSHMAAHARMLSDKINVATWYVEFLERAGASA